MMQVEAQNFFDNEVRGLYPDWEPTAAQASAWVRSLKTFTSEIAGIALQQFYATTAGDYKKPKHGKIIELARAQQQRDGTIETKTGGAPVLLYALKCVKHPNGKRVGTVQKFYASNLKYIPADKSLIMRWAEAMLERFKGLYNGEWEIIRHWDAEEIPF